MDIFGLPFSDDDEEEYTPPIDDNEGDKENDAYILGLVPEIIPLPENIIHSVNQDTSKIAERTRARGTNTLEVGSEIPFDFLQPNQNEMDPELREKEEYRKFIQGVFFNDTDGNQAIADNDDADDEDYEPPKDAAPDTSYKKRISEKDVNSVTLDSHIRREEKPIRPRLCSSSVVPNLLPQTITLNPMQYLVLQSQFMCFAQLLIQQYLLCSKSDDTKPLLPRIRNLLFSLKEASNIPAASSSETTSANLNHLQILRKLTVFNTGSRSPHPVNASIATVLNYDSILRVFDLIDALYAQISVPPIQNIKQRKEKSKPLDFSNDPVFTSVMNSFNDSFEPKLKPTITPSNKLGGYGSTGRLQFTPSEDLLLALGVTLLGDDYELIAKELLVTKEVKQLRNRSKNQRNNQGKNNVIRRYYAFYTDFQKWDKNMFASMCDIITTHVTSWQVMQRVHFYFYNEWALKYYWLYSYFQMVKQQRKVQNTTTPFFLTTPYVQAAARPFIQRTVPLQPARPIPQIRMQADASTQIYEKDVILGDELDRPEPNVPNEPNEFADKRAKTGDDIEREELSDD